MPKLTEDQIIHARDLIAKGMMRKDIAIKFGVSPQAIGRATKGVEKPEQRGLHNRKKAKKIWGFKEDLEW